MHKLNKNIQKGKLMDCVPKLDDILDSFVNEVMDKVGVAGDDVSDVELEENASDSSDDEQYDIIDEEEMPYEADDILDVNTSLDAAICF